MIDLLGQIRDLCFDQPYVLFPTRELGSDKLENVCSSSIVLLLSQNGYSRTFSPSLPTPLCTFSTIFVPTLLPLETNSAAR